MSITYCKSSAVRLLTSSTRKNIMIELRWAGVFLGIHGWANSREGECVSSILRTVSGGYTVSMGSLIFAPVHTIEKTLFGTFDEAKEAVETLVWVHIIGGNHG